MKSKTFQVSKYGFTSSEDALKMYTKMYIVATNTYLSREDFEKKKVTSDTIVIYADKGNENVLIKHKTEGGDILKPSDPKVFMAFYCACMECKSPDVVTLLLKAGVDLNAKNSAGYTGLWAAACSNKNPKIVKALVKAGANVNELVPLDNGPVSLLMYSVLKYNAECMDILIAAGADVNYCEDEFGISVLMFAAQYGSSIEIAEKLIKAGADIHACNKYKNTALMYAGKYNPSLDMLRILIKYGAKVNALDSSGNTALFHAAKFNKNPEYVDVLLENDADASIKNNEGQTAYEYSGNSKLAGK